MLSMHAGGSCHACMGKGTGQAESEEAMKRVDAEKLEALAKMFESPNAIPAGEYTRGYNNGLNVASEAIRFLIIETEEEASDGKE